MDRLFFSRRNAVLRLFCFILPFLLLLCQGRPSYVARADESSSAIAAPKLASQAAVVIDAGTGQVLYQKQKDQKMAPASITKIVSAIVALESEVPLDEKITMSYDAVFSVPRYSSHIALDEGEELTMEDALYAMMLASANDAANGIAEKVAGSNEEFVKLMNALAQKVGAVNTNFTNPHGLIDSNHYTTAYDMALLTRYALQNEAFLPFFSTVTYEMKPTNKQPEARTFSNQNEMIKNTAYKYDGAFGGKLGYTEEALYTIVTAAKRDGRTLICVCMRSDPYVQQYADAAAALDFAFDQYKKVEMTADDLSVRSISFAQKEGEAAPATAQILTTAESVYYLPKALTKDDYTITFNYSETGNQLEGFAPKAIITLNQPVEGIPSTIEVPLSSNISSPVTASESASSSQSGEGLSAVAAAAGGVMKTLWNILKWVLLTLLALAILLVLLRMWFVYDAKRKRRQRLEREKRRKALLKQREHEMNQYLRKEEFRKQMRGSSHTPSSSRHTPDRSGRY